MPDPDIPFAARMVAHRTRQGIRPDHDHLVALLPWLDVLAAGAGADRMERMAEAICRANCRRESHVCDRDVDGDCLPGKCPRRFALGPEARAAIAIADAEAAARAPSADLSAPRDFRHRERFKSGVRAAVTWLHGRAAEMIDPHAQAVLNSAAAGLGWDLAADRVPDGAAPRPHAAGEGNADG